MATSPQHGSIAFVAEIARYLIVEPPEVQTMIRVAKLPAFKIPKATRHVYRVPLRDFHAWLLHRTANPTPELASYEKFLTDFDRTARPRKTLQDQDENR